MYIYSINNAIIHVHVHVCVHDYMYMKILVPSMLAIGVETINKQTQQTSKQPQWLIKFIKHSHKGLIKY